eukprot:scaffold34917_cov166-Amphora_coffeaeformis.AAC.1
MTTQNLYSHHHGRDLTIQHIEGGLPEPDVETTNLHKAVTPAARCCVADGFHSRGLVATQELCDMMSRKTIVPLQQQPTTTASTTATATSDTTLCILDVGCALGESSRFLASHFGAKVVGMDICEEFVSVARVLTEKEGLQDQVKHVRGNALRMPFPDESFDLVFMEHMEMSIAPCDKGGFYKEMARILKPAGHVLLHDIFLGSSAAAPSYPVPWAEREEMSMLVPFETVRTVAASNGLYVAQSKDVTAITEEFFEELLPPSNECPTLEKENSEITSLEDEESAIKLQNHIHNLSSRRIIVLMVVMTKM